MQECLERLSLVEFAQNPQLFVAIGLDVWDLHAFLNPAPLIWILDVHVLDADRARVCIAQHAEDLAQLHQWSATEPTGCEFAIEIPQGQAVAQDIEIRVGSLGVLERVGIGHEVAAHAVSVDDLLDANGLVEVGFVACGNVMRPTNRLVGDPKRPEEITEEVLFAQEKLVDTTQELTGLRTLDDAMVVGAGERHDL